MRGGSSTPIVDFNILKWCVFLQMKMENGREFLFKVTEKQNMLYHWVEDNSQVCLAIFVRPSRPR